MKVLETVIFIIFGILGGLVFTIVVSLPFGGPKILISGGVEKWLVTSCGVAGFIGTFLMIRRKWGS